MTPETEKAAPESPPPPSERASLWNQVRQGYRSSSRKSKQALLLILVAGSVPWIVGYSVLLWLRHQDRETAMAGPLREGQEELTRAQEALKNPDLPRAAADRAAGTALAAFRQVIMMSAGGSKDAWLGAGRAYEILRLEGEAEEAYRKAEPLPGARLGLVRICLRKLYNGDHELDWKAEARTRLGKLPSGMTDEGAGVMKAYLEGRWEDVRSQAAALGETESANDVVLMAAALAALETGRFDPALEELHRLERLFYPPATVRYYCGLTYAGKGEKGQARDEWTAALQAAPPLWPLSLDAQVHRDRLSR
jgi:hypothetical protein